MKTPQWRELCAKHIREGRQPIVGVVLHDTVGRGTHRDTRYLVNPNQGREISADFSVERDGSVWKLNPDLNRYYCLHAGRATAFKGLTNAEVTRATIGIEICQHRDLKLKPLYPEAQVKSVAELCAWISKEFQLTADDITTHHQIITDGSRSDPRDFPFEGPSGFWSFYRQALERGDEFVACETTSESGRNRLRRIAGKLTRLVRFSRS
ncbi:MAG TPA: peptidoglycan recognition family protein [Pyrinomonadaceae bacterium]|nr:peptidoglycan recognition family protein [Pyrinomonadaceae bacterium]